ncbi:MAG: 50S ribosomal protein L6 [Candidatus Portnoybacteria bacterium CG_4_8_14_3_um_filter_44_10]|uniref:Large ribosomal subunit protein uL6 n=5 Tax=Candidatus Portnoyibacteriota TaxID=1817913 RepID=A0A2H0KTA1_9BACT|nr:MAG: 50S ribosomal protein L6 [Parcubacteria group bacterium CG2_30_44_18]PIQ74654.1 MAG: 50S ribosomal protein L6 [Candidatus Portnoybacteria bacterium CG11_big_fil_rev_8_21_14_0_20_44_10]PIS16512.1 MAG: 50S ribosomal protein L6 [Candidatus Portnoybacteria bacterium CG09_land_8_20_14_0_10_44_13]PIW75134.1 MAG: 50S ribosomal protein L6 [Candidatus Portnoybacteria bacterium CG_4_8_14_3_um_filter_44_10]PIZ69799.1 MAG: 50S ribosomal protein L6 [Candidatus Portnoybacteria bacterium CG_4_10_14_0_
MSKIGKQPINIPQGVEVRLAGHTIVVKGPKGELTRDLPGGLSVEIKDNQVIVSPSGKIKKVNALWGLMRALIFNMVMGVTEGFGKTLEIEGVGYKASLQGNKLVLSLGFSHLIEFDVPDGIELKVEKNVISVSGIDKGLVGQAAANIRAFKKPEPYKGKGIRYRGEIVRRKAGKKAVGTA